MKKVIVILIVICLCVATFSGCDNNDESTYENNSVYDEIESENEAENEQEDSSSGKDNISEIPQPETTVDIPWTEFSKTETDSLGYSFKITYKVSPWILLSNTEIANSAWRQITTKYSLPTTFEDWGLELDGDSYARRVEHTYDDFKEIMSDMYYCMGTITIENITNGWDITSDNQRVVNIGSWLISGIEKYYHFEHILVRKFYSDGAKDSLSFQSKALMKKNTWEVPFIVMSPEYYSPNYPNGKNAEDIKKSYFTNYTTTFVNEDEHIYLGVYGKDGQYTPPIK